MTLCTTGNEENTEETQSLAELLTDVNTNEKYSSLIKAPVCQMLFFSVCFVFNLCD